MKGKRRIALITGCSLGADNSPRNMSYVKDTS